MWNLRDKIMSGGGKDPGKLEELGQFQIDLVKQSEENSRDPNDQRERIHIDESVVNGISTLRNPLQNLCDRSQELCRNALDEITSLVCFVKSRLTEVYRQNEENGGENLNQEQLEMEISSLSEQDYEHLKTQLDSLRSAQNEFLAEFEKRCTVLRNEYDNYRHRINEQPKISDRTNMQQQLDVALDELKAERDRANQGKERSRITEVQMQKARAKIRDLETQVANEDTKSQQLQNTIRTLEAQLKQKEQAVEQRMRDMHKAMKSSEGLVAKMEKQRDTFESRLSICHRLSVRSFARLFVCLPFALARLCSP